MSKIKIGVIGVGHLGRFHTKLFSEIEGIDLVGIHDEDPNRSEHIAKEFNVNSFAKIEDLLENADGVSVAVPTSKHYSIAKKALEYNCHIFVEKPVTSTIEEATELTEIAEARNRVFQVGHIERFNGALIALDGIDIDPLFIEAHRLAGFTPRGADVAVVLDLMIHDIDLILSFVKSPIKSLYASGAKIISETEDIANCRITFENGCVANITSSRISAKKMRKMRVFQKNAYFSIDFDKGFSEVYHTDELVLDKSNVEQAISLGALKESSVPREIYYTQLTRNDVNALKLECKNFIDSIRTGTDPIVTGKDGLKALEVAKRILQAIEEHKGLIESNKGLRG